MKNIVLGVGEYGASNTADGTVKTFALGSCIAVIIMHPPTMTVGMVHVALPDSSTNAERAKERPGYFADTGIPALMQEMGKISGNKTPKGYVVKIAGGAKVMDPDSLFNIGERNDLAIKKILWKFGLGPLASDVGGSISRTVAGYVNTGEIILSSPGREDWKL